MIQGTSPDFQENLAGSKLWVRHLPKADDIEPAMLLKVKSFHFLYLSSGQAELFAGDLQSWKSILP